MPRNTPISEISRAALEGVENAFTSYEEISGAALDYAPEYFLTCEIAKAIGKVSKGCIHLEENISGTLSDAGAVGPGKPKSSLKKNGRYDLVVRYANDNPYGVIEVKHPVWMYRTIQSDIRRLRDTVSKSIRSNGSIKFGALVFYASSNFPIRKYSNLEEKFTGDSGWYNTWVERAMSDINIDGLSVTLNHTGMHDHGDWGWAGGIIVIS